MSEMIESVARAICVARGVDLGACVFAARHIGIDLGIDRLEARRHAAAPVGHRHDNDAGRIAITERLSPGQPPVLARPAGPAADDRHVRLSIGFRFAHGSTCILSSEASTCS